MCSDLHAAVIRCLHVKTVTFPFWQPEKQPLEQQVLLCVSSALFLWSNRQEEELFGGEIFFVLTDRRSWLLNVWPSVMLRSSVTSFPHITGPTNFPHISEQV